MKNLFFAAVLVVTIMFGASLLLGESLAYANTNDACAAIQNSGATSSFCDSKTDTLVNNNPNRGLNGIINILLYIIGVAAVISIIIGGIRYTTANGDASQVKSAKDVIMYAVIGLVVAIMAWGIVNFVVARATENL